MSDPYNILYTINPIKNKYQYFETVYSIVLQLLQHYDKLKLSIQQSPKFNYPVIQLNGLLPIKVENRTFGAPIRIHFPYDYPKTAPYVTCPTGESLEIVKNHPFVNENGYIGYIQYNWSPNANFFDMIQYLIYQFSQKPPVRKCAPPLPPHQNQQNYQNVYHQNVYQQQIMKQSQQTPHVKQPPQQSNPYLHQQSYQTTYHHQPSYSYYNTQNPYHNQSINHQMNQYSPYHQQQINHMNQLNQVNQQYQRNQIYQSTSMNQSFTGCIKTNQSQSYDNSYQQRINEQVRIGQLQREIQEKKGRINKDQEEIISLKQFIEIHKNDHINKSPIDYFIQNISKEEFKRISNESTLQSVEEELSMINDLMSKRIITLDDALDQIKYLASLKFDIIKQSSN